MARGIFSVDDYTGSGPIFMTPSGGDHVSGGSLVTDLTNVGPGSGDPTISGLTNSNHVGSALIASSFTSNSYAMNSTSIPNEMDSSDSDEDESNNISSSPSPSPPENKKLTCPYYKRNPGAFPNCAGIGHSRFSKLKS